MIFVNDHDPPHVHVFLGRFQAKIRIDEDEPRLVENEGMNRSDLQKARRLVSQYQVFLRQRWMDFHG